MQFGECYCLPSSGGLARDCAAALLDCVVIITGITLINDHGAFLHRNSFHKRKDLLNIFSGKSGKEFRLKHARHPVRVFVCLDLTNFYIGARSAFGLQASQLIHQCPVDDKYRDSSLRLC